MGVGTREPSNVGQVEVFCVVTPCGHVVGDQRFGGPCYLHLQGEEF
jgi:hypothetical protein